MSRHLSDALVKRIEATARGLVDTPPAVLEVLNGVLVRPVIAGDGDAA